MNLADNHHVEVHATIGSVVVMVISVMFMNGRVKMYAVEFESDVTNGVVHLPVELQKMRPHHLRFIALLPEENEVMSNKQLKKALDFADQFDAFHLGWGEGKMTREQMNER